MGSLNKSYDPAAMANVKIAFRDVWETLQSRITLHGEQDAAELKAAIIRRLIDLVADGTTNPDELKAKVLKNLPPG